LPTRQLVRLALGERLQLYHAQGIGDTGRNFTGRGFLHPQAKGDVFENRHVGEQGVALKDGIDVAVFSRNLSNILIFKVNMAVIDVFQPGDKAKHCRFTAARRAKQRKKFAVVDGQIEVGNDGFSVKAFTNSGQLHQR